MKYFEISEFDSKDLPGSGDRMDPNFLIKLDLARGVARVPFVINSGYRTPEHNKKVGGKPNSPHLRAKAADIKVDNSLNRFKILRSLLDVGFVRIGIADTFIHVDSDESLPQNVIWTY